MKRILALALGLGIGLSLLFGSFQFSPVGHQSHTVTVGPAVASADGGCSGSNCSQICSEFFAAELGYVLQFYFPTTGAPVSQGACVSALQTNVQSAAIAASVCQQISAYLNEPVPGCVPYLTQFFRAEGLPI